MGYLQTRDHEGHCQGFTKDPGFQGILTWVHKRYQLGFTRDTDLGSLEIPTWVHKRYQLGFTRDTDLGSQGILTMEFTRNSDNRIHNEY